MQSDNLKYNYLNYNFLLFYIILFKLFFILFLLIFFKRIIVTFVKLEKNSIFLKNGKTIISVENRKFYKSQMTKRTSPLNSSHEI